MPHAFDPATLAGVRESAGLMMYRVRGWTLEIFLAHPGGPYFQNKDQSFWGIPKGLVERDEDRLSAARREFEEETGIGPAGEFVSLGTVQQRSGKIIYAWAFGGDWDPAQGITSNRIPVEWPPRTNRFIEVPEIDRAAFFPADIARQKVSPPQRAFIDRLERHLAESGQGPA